MIDTSLRDKYFDNSSAVTSLIEGLYRYKKINMYILVNVCMYVYVNLKRKKNYPECALANSNKLLKERLPE